MQDVSPGVAAGGFIGLLTVLLGIVAELLKARNKRRLNRLEKDIPPSDTSHPPPSPPSTRLPATLPREQPSLAVQLEARNVELLRTRYEVEELQQALRRQRRAVDEAMHEHARKQAEAVGYQARMAAELERARARVAELEEALRRQRRALDETARDQARMAAELSAERGRNEQLLEEMRVLRTQGEAHRGTERRGDADPHHNPERHRDRTRAATAHLGETVRPVPRKTR